MPSATFVTSFSNTYRGGTAEPYVLLPTAQKDITRRARRRGLPVIVATQVLESMTTEPRPTRAEVSDAANAVDDGVDAIMLAGETAAGAFSARTVLTLDAIISEAESGMRNQWPAEGSDRGKDDTQAVRRRQWLLANRSDARAIVAVTRGQHSPGGSRHSGRARRLLPPAITRNDHHSALGMHQGQPNIKTWHSQISSQMFYVLNQPSCCDHNSTHTTLTIINFNSSAASTLPFDQLTTVPPQ